MTFLVLPLDVRNELDRLTLHYDVDRTELDRGTNGYVFFARNRITGRDVAIKFYPVEPSGKQHLEPHLLAKIQSPNVLEILDARSIGDEWAFFITPRCDGGDLNDHMCSGISAIQALDLTLGICLGVSAIHAKGLVHRDLKPDNIMLDRGVAKIADFGSVRLIPHGTNEVAASQHTLLYRPPESFGRGVHGKAGDVYQIGVVAYQLLGGSLPYDLQAYMNARELRQFRSIADAFDRDRFVDEVVSRRITTKRLLRMDSLPPWATPAKKVLNGMVAPNLASRYANISDAATLLQALRAKIPDWRTTATGARLTIPGRTVEIRATATKGKFLAFVDVGAGFRRARGVLPDSLEALVAAF